MGDWWTHGRIYGDQAHFTEPDDQHNEVIIYWGSNSYVSHQFPNAKRICRGFSQHPDKMVIAVDPRVSETARMADMHIRPRIGSDSLYLRALIAVIVQNGWENKEFINAHATGWAQALRWFVNFDIDAALEVCQVSRAQTEEFARILTTKKWGMHRDLGIYFGRHSTTSSYLAVLLQVTALNLIVYAVAVGSIAAVGETIPWKELNLLHLAYYLMQLVLVGICFGLSAFLRGGSVGLGIGIAVGLYFLNLIANITEKAAVLKHFTPFGFCDGAEIVSSGTLEAGWIAVGLAVGAACVLAAFLYYPRKDIHT
jgi:hypothetical protein